MMFVVCRCVLILLFGLKMIEKVSDEVARGGGLLLHTYVGSCK